MGVGRDRPERQARVLDDRPSPASKAATTAATPTVQQSMAERKVLKYFAKLRAGAGGTRDGLEQLARAAAPSGPGR